MNRSLLKVFQGNVDVAQPTTSRSDQFPGIAGEVRGDSRYTSPYSMSSMSRPSQRMNVPTSQGQGIFIHCEQKKRNTSINGILRFPLHCFGKALSTWGCHTRWPGTLSSLSAASMKTVLLQASGAILSRQSPA